MKRFSIFALIVLAGLLVSCKTTNLIDESQNDIELLNNDERIYFTKINKISDNNHVIELVNHKYDISITIQIDTSNFNDLKIVTNNNISKATSVHVDLTNGQTWINDDRNNYNLISDRKLPIIYSMPMLYSKNLNNYDATIILIYNREGNYLYLTCSDRENTSTEITLKEETTIIKRKNFNLKFKSTIIQFERT